MAVSLNLAHLHALRELSRLGTMVAVAHETGYTVGAVSQQISSLERSVGTRLTARVGRNVVLTDAGAVLAEHAGRLLQDQQRALEAIRSVEGRAAAPVLVGTFGSTAATVLPQVIAEASRRSPELLVQSMELDVDDALAAVRRGHVDVAFGLEYATAPLPRHDDVRVTHLLEERFAVAVAPGYQGVRERTSLPLAALAAWDWVLAPERTQFGRAFRASCRQAGFEPRAAHQVVETAVAIALASAGLGAAPVTDLMLTLNPSLPLAMVELEERVVRRIVLITPRATAQNSTVRAVCDAARAAVGPLGGSADSADDDGPV